MGGDSRSIQINKCNKSTCYNQMGNQKSTGKQSWSKNYRIIGEGRDGDSCLKLEDLNTGQHYIHKTLISNSEDDAADILELIHEKNNDPSPFVSKLLEFKQETQENYCSTTKSFYLLFDMADKTLKEEIVDRKRQRKRFVDSQVNSVLDNVSKGLLHLYKIGHHHCAVSPENIAWPNSFEETVQLVDPWSIDDSQVQVTKRERMAQEKGTAHENDLYCLGSTVLQMLNSEDEKYSLSIESKLSRVSDPYLRRKVDVLLSQPSERMKIYDLIAKEATRLIQSTKSSEHHRMDSTNSFPEHKSFYQPNGVVSMNHQQPQQVVQFSSIQSSQHNLNYSNHYPSSSLQSTPIENLHKRTSMVTFQKQPNPTISHPQAYRIQNRQHPPLQISQPPPPPIHNSHPSLNSNPLAAISNFSPSVEKKDENLFTSPEFMTNLLSFTKSKTQQKSSLVDAPVLAVSMESSVQSEESKPKEVEVAEVPVSTPKRIRTHKQKISTIHERSEQSHSEDGDRSREDVIQYYDTGSRYQGEKCGGMRNGRGKFYYQEGSFYDGEWKDNKMHGNGQLYYANGKLAYEGEWYMDEFHGFGKVFNDNCVVEEGMFDYRDFNQLDEQWQHYEGSLVSDSKEGFGKIVLGNGEQYEGYFSSDRLNGEGKFTRKDGEVIRGVWKDSVLEKVL